jgi:hypothetical protein
MFVRKNISPYGTAIKKIFSTEIDYKKIFPTDIHGFFIVLAPPFPLYKFDTPHSGFGKQKVEVAPTKNTQQGCGMIWEDIVKWK